MLVDDQGHACICDFGLSSIMHGMDFTDFASTTKSTRGTTRWMAPELLYPEKYGLKKFTPTFESDVYTFACVILEVRTLLSARTANIVKMMVNHFADHDRKAPLLSIPQ